MVPARRHYRGDAERVQDGAWRLDLRSAAAGGGGAALLVIDPQRAFTTGGWANHFGDVGPIEASFEKLATLLSARRPLILVTRCP